MARGDVWSDSYISIAGGGVTDVQPAAGVEVMIVCLMANTTATTIRGKDSAGNVTGDLATGLFGADTTLGVELAALGERETKIIITNAEFIQLYASSASTVLFHGVQTK
jgi:hypothetical protein